MNNTVNFLQHSKFSRILFDSFPFILIILDDKGRVQIANSQFERTIGLSRKAVTGKSIGEALRCIHAAKTNKKYGATAFCSGCDARALCLTAIKKNRVQRSRTFLHIKNNGQVRDVVLRIIAVPFTLNNKRFINLVIEDIPGPHPTAQPSRQKGCSEIIGNHPKMKELFRSIRQAARTAITVLIQGETGTGKELVARTIHTHSSRASKYFVPVNCGALPEGLLETELFGHLKGAFTGAIRDKKGRFALADGGTLFFDEVGDLSPSMQVRLLRVLQDGYYHPVGSEKAYRADVRILSATNKKLEREVAAGRFRKDLYYRLSTMPIILPPLRERRSDIPILAEHFLEHYGREFFAKKARLSFESVSMLTAYDWPGNVRELQNTIQFALAQCPGNLIAPSHFLPAIRLAVSKPLIVRQRPPRLQAQNVINALEKVGDNKTKAAELLGVSRSTLYRFLKNYKESLSQNI